MVINQKLELKNAYAQGRFLKIPNYIMAPTGGGHWISGSGLMFYSAVLNKTLRFESGEVNNLASIPFPMRNIINPNGTHRLAAALHDALYSRKGIVSIESHIDHEVILSRKESDAVFFESMTSTKHNYWQALDGQQKNLLRKAGFEKLFIDIHEPVVEPLLANIMWAGVRIGGGFFWHK